MLIILSVCTTWKREWCYISWHQLCTEKWGGHYTSLILKHYLLQMVINKGQCKKLLCNKGNLRLILGWQFWPVLYARSLIYSNTVFSTDCANKNSSFNVMNSWYMQLRQSWVLILDSWSYIGNYFSAVSWLLRRSSCFPTSRGHYLYMIMMELRQSLYTIKT